jgi:ADP-ribose pyrophosphatase
LSELAPWHTESSRTILDLPPWFSVIEDTVKLPNGRIVNDYYRIKASDYVLISARRDDGCILMERHYKQCLGRFILTSPAGGVDEGEAPLDAAKRELLEETGFEADHWTSMGSFMVDGTRGICTAHLFSAETLRRVAEPMTNDMEEFELRFMSADEIRAAIQARQISLLPDITILSMTLGRL